MANYKVLLFYKFVRIDDLVAMRDFQRSLCESLGLKGRILIAQEGINGTLEGTVEATDAYINTMHAHELFAEMPFKESVGTGAAFPKLKVKVRDEVVTLGVGEFDIQHETATELSADELENLYDRDEDFVVLDLRNDYEIDSGYFEKTVHPHLRNFRDLPKKLSSIAHLKEKKIVAVCTGGIRCEKATCLLKREGFKNIYQLKDGIHTYMLKYPGKRFKGTLFVFDNRMVSDVTDIQGKVVVGKCVFCNTASEDYYNDDSVVPSKRLICCSECIKTATGDLRRC